MSHYLIRSSNGYTIIEADSAKQAVREHFNHLQGTEDGFDVWTLRSGEPRTYTVRVEERIIIE